MERERQRDCERIERERRAFLRSIPNLYEELVAGRALMVIAAKDLPEWCRAVRHCLEGMYGDLCIRSALDIIGWLHDGDEFSAINEKSKVYGHSGGSWCQTIQLVKRFGGPRGESFFEYSTPPFIKK